MYRGVVRPARLPVDLDSTASGGISAFGRVNYRKLAALSRKDADKIEEDGSMAGSSISSYRRQGFDLCTGVLISFHLPRIWYNPGYRISMVNTYLRNG